MEADRLSQIKGYVEWFCIWYCFYLVYISFIEDDRWDVIVRGGKLASIVDIRARVYEGGYIAYVHTT